MTGEASCHPVRLVRFEGAVHAICDGLVRRTHMLDSALATYNASCAAPFLANTSGAVAAIAETRGALRGFATWTGDVGRGFMRADAVEGYLLQAPRFDREGLATTTDDEVGSAMPTGWVDPFLGVLVASSDPADDPISGDQGGPPAWLERVRSGGELAEVYGELLTGYAAALAGARATYTVTRLVGGNVGLLADGALVVELTPAQAAARFLWPASGGRLGATAEWLRRGGAAVQFAIAGYGQWSGDVGHPTGDRVLRSATRGGGSALAAAGGSAAGGLVAGSTCGPGAPVCSSILAVAGGAVGVLIGDEVVDVLPWMGDRRTEPGEVDLDDLRSLVAADDGRATYDDLGRVNLLAGDLVISRPSGDPLVDARVQAVVPSKPLVGPPAPPPAEPITEVLAGVGTAGIGAVAGSTWHGGKLYQPTTPTLDAISGPQPNRRSSGDRQRAR